MEAIETYLPPTKEDIKNARKAAGLTQTEAAELVYHHFKSWQAWEYGLKVIHRSTWELFQIKAKVLQQQVSFLQQKQGLLQKK